MLFKSNKKLKNSSRNGEGESLRNSTTGIEDQRYNEAVDTLKLPTAAADFVSKSSGID